MNYTKQMQKIITDYRESKENWPATKREIAAWAINTGRWQMPASTVIDRCANDLGEAMGEMYILDKKGRRVRQLHAAPIRRQGVLFTEWDDIRTATRQHMHLSSQNKRRSIVGECRQMKVDLDSYNEAHPDQVAIQISFDFTMDIAEYEAALAA
jgi:hypothetical protein